MIIQCLLIVIFCKYVINPIIDGFGHIIAVHKQLKKDEPKIYGKALCSFGIEFILTILILTLMICL